MKKLELKLLQAFKDLQNTFPNLTALSFEIHKFAGESEPTVCGFYHPDEKCFSYDSMDELAGKFNLSKKAKEAPK